MLKAEMYLNLLASMKAVPYPRIHVRTCSVEKIFAGRSASSG